MTNDLIEAVEQARGVADALRAKGQLGGTGQTVYVIEGCDCVEQGGIGYRYHVHAFDDQHMAGWRALHDDYEIPLSIEK